MPPISGEFTYEGDAFSADQPQQYEKRYCHPSLATKVCFTLFKKNYKISESLIPVLHADVVKDYTWLLQWLIILENESNFHVSFYQSIQYVNMALC